MSGLWVRRRIRWTAAAVAMAMVFAACGGSNGRGTDAADPTTTTPEPAADTSAPAVVVTPGENAPNPFVLVEEDRYLLYSTQESFFEPNIALRTGPSLTELGSPTEVMPHLPAWAYRGHTWAPDVRKVGSSYVLWFTARLQGGRDDFRDKSQCIGVAVASDPEGPFRSPEDEPAVCQLDRWGSIDPRTFLDDDGSLWLHWKSDDNAELDGSTKATIFAQRLKADGRTLLGGPTAIMSADQAWEGRIVEAPQMVQMDDRYWLYYSGNWFNQPYYGTGVAECEGPAGPCRKPNDGPWLGSNDQGEGPGEGSLFEDEGGWWFAYAPAAVQFEDDTARPVALAPVAVGPDGPYLAERSGARAMGARR